MQTVLDIDSEKLDFSHSEVTGDNGELTYIFVRTEYPEEWGDNALKEVGKYHVSIVAVSPSMVDEETKKSALDGWEGWRERPEFELCGDLMMYGAYATLWQQSGNNRAKLLKGAREKLKELRITLGFALDGSQNAIGASGWDFMAGNPTGRRQ